LGSTGAHHDTGVLTLVQLATVAVVCGTISAWKERVGPPTDLSVIGAIVLCGVLASALAFAVQTWAQKRLPPARVALILVSETAWGGVFGWSAAGVWPAREVAGAALMFAGLVISEALAAFGAGAEKVAFEPAVEGAPAPVVEQASAATDALSGHRERG
jgi:drug/metabolite transporter (DMT)-like permease